MAFFLKSNQISRNFALTAKIWNSPWLKQFLPPGRPPMTDAPPWRPTKWQMSGGMITFGNDWAIIPFTDYLLAFIYPLIYPHLFTFLFTLKIPSPSAREWRARNVGRPLKPFVVVPRLSIPDLSFLSLCTRVSLARAFVEQLLADRALENWTPMTTAGFRRVQLPCYVLQFWTKPRIRILHTFVGTLWKNLHSYVRYRYFCM